VRQDRNQVVYFLVLRLNGYLESAANHDGSGLVSNGLCGLIAISEAVRSAVHGRY
jgi:hypothetical protein